ncbi:A/G-specific adenine glycosylase [Dokdonia sinensis]|uniref:Adenine DNA glycosylase n=1 Tax=Dokdonia sinensis TaxID=2479847 RepID=A0A3M0G3D2_9FLAO|nr:A/G-specific adenine glycosylase [Dokdonia sinensis]RMB56423.1 A/G-specific adenine glycosylase [Dokdonia sinensis]
MPKNNPVFANQLIEWYLDNKRAMPWRETKNPYFIWLSEIILQQTRVAQGLPYYLAFTEAYPTVQQLAAAPQEDILKLWQGLGYYSRARNLHAAAQMVVTDYNSIFPNNYRELLKLKGVGDYTASAIASICFDEPAAVVDGNVYRVLSRIFGIDTPINSSQGIKEFKKLASGLMDRDRPADFNQAIMEFGAIQCTPKNPYCLHCVFNDRCVALQKSRIHELPVKINKTKVKKRYLNYIFIKTASGDTVLQQRTGKGIWQGLYEFPFIEAKGPLGEDRFRESVKSQNLLPNVIEMDITRYNDTPIVHKLSHQHLYTTFWIVDVAEIDRETIPVHSIRNYPVPVLIANFIEKNID